ncbi:MAG: glycosyltransferase family 1 protein [Chloroflexi bacterium]|nr:glycosyltransferase family 1 protein [Chloroflexota bacterium]
MPAQLKQPPVKRIAMLSVHTSPLARLGRKKTGGMNVYVREIARALGANGVQVDVFTRVASPAERHQQVTEIAPDARLIYVAAGPAAPLDPSEIYRHLPQFRDGVLAFAAEQQLAYELIYSHYWLSGWVALALKASWQLPVVQMFHTLGRMKDRIAEGNSSLDTPTIRLDERNIRVAVETEIMNKVDRLIAATPAEQIQMLWLYRADRRNIEIVPPGVTLNHFRPMDRAESRAAIGLQPEERMLLFVGRIEPLKGVETICRALNHLLPECPDILENLTVHIVGGDPDRESPDNAELQRLRALCHQLGLEDIVRFVGSREQSVLPYYYNAAEALIMPSDYESFGMVALEAMACGTLVIASQVGGLAFLVDDDVTGFHVPVRDPESLAERIRVVLREPERRQHMAQAARHAAESYSWDLVVERLFAVFSGVLPEKQQPLDLTSRCGEG